MTPTKHPPFRPPPHPTRPRPALGLLACAVAVVLASCASGSTRTLVLAASEEEWRALREPRPSPLEGAPRVTMSGVELLGDYAWAPIGRVSRELGIAELVVTGLLRRRDVHFVERRRFSAAAEDERVGRPRRPGQPPTGVSQSADYSANAVWIVLDDERASIEVRLTHLESGRVAGATRSSVATDVDPVALGRAIVGGILEVLDEVGARPAWDDPMGANAGQGARVSTQAVRSFMLGLAAEEVWDWEGARRGYQSAMSDPGFHEARAALARAARLRLGGTLGES